MNEKIVSAVEADRILKAVRAQFVREANGAKVYVAKQINVTITAFPGPQPGTIKLRSTRGCVC